MTLGGPHVATEHVGINCFGCKSTNFTAILMPSGRQRQVAFQYLRFAAGIDIHNHLRTGSAGFEDVWLTKSPQHRQFAGIVGFLFTNAYQSPKYFGDKSISHCAFKMDLSNRMVCFQDYNSVVLRRSLLATATETTKDAPSHELASLAPIGVKKQKLCFPVAQRNCWRLHVTHGMPAKNGD